jgi:hypothetical protein
MRLNSRALASRAFTKPGRACRSKSSWYLNTFDSAIVFSQADRQALAAFSPHLDIHVSPFPSPEEPLPSPVRFVLACKRFVFVASELLRPNADGLSWFMKEVWPAVKNDLPDASIEVIGKWSLEAQSRVPNHEEIRFVGFVPELLSPCTASNRGCQEKEKRSRAFLCGRSIT